MRLTGNTILVTGGGSGIGRGLAVALHQGGNRVVIAGRRVEALRMIAGQYPGIGYLPLDLSDRQSIQCFVGEVERQYPHLNVVINNAGMMAFEDPDVPDPDTASAVVLTNLLGPIVLTSLLAPRLKSQHNAAIINMTSTLAFVPMAIAPTYSATKAGLHAYTESMRFLLQDSGIDVIEVVPPRVKTEMDGPTDTNTLAVDEFVAEVLSLMAIQPEAGEVVVAAARRLREAERNGVYAEQFGLINAGLSSNPRV